MTETPTTTNPEMKNDNNSNHIILIPNKSPSDPRNYKIITLSNDLECIVVSDPEAEKAACAMCVRVGHFADPDTLPGLAHFLEHMLFLGTKKYPDEAEYKQFLKDHGGSSNASTGMHDTCYQFDVGSEYLPEAIDRFAQFFINPLFTESATDRELNAVNSEDSNNEQSDAHRFYQFDKSLANKTHPFHKFGTGNIRTLKLDVDKSINVRSQLLSFYDEYYSSSVMKLAIVGKQDVDQLCKLAENSFSPIANKKINEPKYETYPHVFGDINYLYKLVPIVEKRQLKLKWIMDSNCYYVPAASTCMSLLSFCLGDECVGSILSYLKELGYASGLVAGLNYKLPEFCMMNITVDLTPNGLNKYKEIIAIIYKYISKMKLLTNNEWNNYFIERRKVREMIFNFKGKEKEYGYARSLAMNLQRFYPRENFLQFSSGLLFEYDYGLMLKYLNYLTADNCYYQLISKEIEDECKEKEKWYGTLYNKEVIELETDIVIDVDKLFTPLENKYIADDFRILCDENDDKKNEKDDEDMPYIIRETPQSKIWFKMDKTFRKPKLCVSMICYSPFLNDKILSSCLTDVIILILNDELSDLTYAFEEAALSFNISFNGSNGIVFKFGGYNDKLNLLIQTVLNKFKNLKISSKKYEINKEKYHRIVVSMAKSQPYSHCDMVDTLFLCPKSVSLYDLQENEQKITYDLVCQQYEKIFEKLYIESLIYGNIDDIDTIKPYYNVIDKYLIQNNETKYTKKQVLNNMNGCLKLEPNNNYCVSFKCPNQQDKNSAISSTYLYKMDNNIGDFAALKLFCHIINAKCFDELRTKQQLGYIVWSFNSATKGFWTFRIIIQSNCANPNKLNCRIEDFLQTQTKDFLMNLDDSSFELNKKSVINNLLEKSKTIYQENAKYWREITRNRYQFQRNENVAKEIEKLTKNDILNVYYNFLQNNSKQRTKLTIQCFGNQHNMETEKETEKDNIGDKESCFYDENVINWDIKDIQDVRQKYGYYPFPYNDTAKL